ncbi:DDE-type integrase/transposase/recombinase [Microvirga sp. BT350]|uniref:DDE-type integrase/transposase/recombinase n=1 Tax=Microvirga alba TaxID=2791025 RepID=A0A931BT77_9HYPH|nr:DDE-type integrase/transposase/recombinase [Microvirga alba]
MLRADLNRIKPIASAEAYIKVRGEWTYLHRAKDSMGDTDAFWFGEHRDLAAAKRILTKFLERHGRPERIVIDGSRTNREAIVSYDTTNRLLDRSRRRLKPIRIRQGPYLNHRIEQIHRDASGPMLVSSRWTALVLFWVASSWSL